MAATGTVLVVDDDPAICVVVGEALRRQGHKVKIAGSIRERTALMESFSPDILITDVMLPDGDGLDGVAEIIERKPDLNVIILSAQNTLNTAIRATEKGAFEYLPKPFDLNELTRAVADALGHRSGGADASEQGLPHDGLPLVGRSPAMQEVYRTIARVLSNDLSILVLGESGTGKELVAEAIHSLGQRRTRPFVAINMAAIPRELIEAELFGYEKGAFTGAQARTAGKFEQAQGGTLFLDEIGDMPMEAQTRLLRVLQSGEVTTVGGSKPVRVDVRIIAATNKDLPRLIEENRFRQDLYYRLNVVPVSLPPLRERREDVILLARHFLDRAAQDGLPRKALAEDAAQLLMAYHWPGNVRELQNIMQRLAVLSRENVIAADMLRHALPLDAVPADHAAPAGQLAQAVREWTKRQLGVGLGQANPQLHDNLLAVIEPILLQETLASVDGNQIRAAGLLGINRNTLRKKLTDYGLDPLQLRLSD
ncbi:MAG: nitrogen regulation protein NR(I) [Sphingobium yanoikuyae]|jgi:two-component system, NtrC family, nitrogen regulation response regulator GlnG|uniref:DNA-binding transcriptional regulator NtrC n=3 Tax=Sphingobium yanoikuyae TaxID=13690 RepID=A0A430CAL5_SPHYA|nr:MULTISPECIES: nitrogen regulation protein NR(I) [Sphingobium]MBO9527361.1 nitrogen regulation protein NR(I) [Sphingobium yanoikuyae]NBB41825.1 nitrogen regulation protein NR(I) [Sphingobium yanoikuyae]PZU61333.1 MAG: nitrogen regulation protein NR(I) [Sphingobium sp.]PZU70257.1 MAG: nitrogen regulation protein NR(I) [Sphingobium sp.]QNG43629.1 nitrogen regulation protein NR(I) [Sphingobium yanoikuyae]